MIKNIRILSLFLSMVFATSCGNGLTTVYNQEWTSSGGTSPAGSSITVTYSGNGSTSGTAPTDNTVYTSGETVTVPGNTGSLVKIYNYSNSANAYSFNITLIFKGWSTSSSATIAEYTAGSTFSITAATTLYAVWSAIGATGPGGGCIFYDSGSITTDTSGFSYRYMEAAPADQGSTTAWGGNGTLIGTATGIGTGNKNTTDIVTILTSATILDCSAKLCNYQTEISGITGCSNWFLPSRDELALMHTNLYTAGDGGFVSSSYYWSSSETTTSLPPPSQYSLYQVFSAGVVQGNYSKGSTLRVRAAREF